jgi:hypothetical protein
MQSWEGDKVFIPIDGVESLSLPSAAAIAIYKFK